MKNVTKLLLIGAAAGITVWYFTTPKGKALLDGTLKDISDNLAGQLKSKLNKAKDKTDDLFDDGVDYVDDVNDIVQHS